MTEEKITDRQIVAMKDFMKAHFSKRDYFDLARTCQDRYEGHCSRSSFVPAPFDSPQCYVNGKLFFKLQATLQKGYNLA